MTRYGHSDGIVAIKIANLPAADFPPFFEYNCLPCFKRSPFHRRHSLTFRNSTLKCLISGTKRKLRRNCPGTLPRYGIFQRKFY